MVKLSISSELYIKIYFCRDMLVSKCAFIRTSGHDRQRKYNHSYKLAYIGDWTMCYFGEVELCLRPKMPVIETF
jgi:hypothetical protein